jgi:hypothetical protein
MIATSFFLFEVDNPLPGSKPPLIGVNPSFQGTIASFVEPKLQARKVSVSEATCGPLLFDDEFGVPALAGSSTA